MSKCKIIHALLWLEHDGWTELIDPRWTLEVYHELEKSGIELSDAEIREVLRIKILGDPDYNQ